VAAGLLSRCGSRAPDLTGRLGPAETIGHAALQPWRRVLRRAVRRDAAFEVRAFIPSGGTGEEPVTGSLNASLAQWLIGPGHASESYVATRGTRLRRRGRVITALRRPDLAEAARVMPSQRAGDSSDRSGAGTPCDEARRSGSGDD